MSFKKKHASGNTREPDAADLGGTGVNPTSDAAESTAGTRPSPARSIPKVSYAEESTDDEEEIDPRTYKEPTPPEATTQKHVRLSIARIGNG
eukprot:jgi/Psemu1/58170/gm1.58170_g